MSTTLQQVTADELFAMPKDGFRYELVKGELRQSALHGAEHGAISIGLTVRLGQHVKSNSLGVCFSAGTGFRLTSHPDTVRAPDVTFVSRERILESSITKKKILAGRARPRRRSPKPRRLSRRGRGKGRGLADGWRSHRLDSQP